MIFGSTAKTILVPNVRRDAREGHGAGGAGAPISARHCTGLLRRRQRAAERNGSKNNIRMHTIHTHAPIEIFGLQSYAVRDARRSVV